MPRVETIGSVVGLQDVVKRLAAPGAVVCIGDSLTSGAGVAFGGYPTILGWLSSRTIVNKGISGDNLALVLARIPQVIALNPSRCVVMVGTNNAQGGTSVVSTADRASVVSITTALMNAGIVPMWCACPPRGDFSGTFNPWICEYNRFLVNHCRTYGIPFVSETYTSIADPVTGNPVAGTLQADNLHPTSVGYNNIAVAVNASLPSVAVNAPWRFVNESQVFANGGFTTDTNADGAADGLTKSVVGTALATATRTAHPLFGFWQNVAITGGTSATDCAQIEAALFTAGVVAGDTLDIEFDLKTNASMAGNNLACYCKAFTAGWGSIGTSVYLFDVLSFPITATNGMRVRGSFTVPANTGNILFRVIMFGTGASDFSIGRLLVRRRL